MWVSPVSAKASIRRTLSATGIIFFSDWKPSRGPSSSMVTRFGKSDIAILLRGSTFFFLERLLAGTLDVGQRHEQKQDRGRDQQAETDRPCDEDRCIATRKQHGASEIFLHLRPEHQPEQEGRALAAQAREDVAQDAEDC